MMKSVVLAASALALAAGLSTAARAEGAGVVPPGTVHNVEHYYVTTCADYLAHPADERAEVINWMTNYQVEGKSPHGHSHHQSTDSWFAGAPLQEVNAACTADPNLLFGTVMTQHHIVSG